jgi:hypothetical protein
MTDVPSNLIPTRISQLPVAPVADENSQMMIIYQGNNYRIRVGDLLSVAGVPLTRQVIAGTGMAGGGQLSANVTLSIAPGGVGSTELAASGVTPGVYGNSTDIPIFTVDATGRVVAATTIPATITGYVPDTRQVIAGTGLTGGGPLNADVTLAAALSDLLPLIGDNAGSAGVSTEMARADHQHPAVDLSDQAQINGILPMDQGGTARSLVPDNGGIVWSGADGLYIGPAGVYGQVLMSAGQAEYVWATIDVDIPRPANTVRAGPVSGPDAIPTFRALVNADIPTTLDGKTLTNVDVNSGTIDGTVIGGSVPAAATVTTLDTDYVDFAPALSPLPVDATGRLYYDNNDQFQTLVFQMNGSVVQHIGEEQFYRIKCQGSITKGQVVMFAGTVGASGGLIGAAATGLQPEQANYILGVADESGSNNDWIFVTSFGEVKQIDTTGGAENWVQGQVLYYNPAVTGGLTKTKPNTPNAIAIVAAVVHVGSSNGILFVRPTYGNVLGATDGNVQFGTLNNGDVIAYDGTDLRWENVAQSSLAVGSATNVAGGGSNQIVYNTGSGATSFITAPTVANTYLEWSGSAFQWSSNPLGTVTSVDVSGGTTGVTFTGGPITTSGTITMGGTLAVANGGTGQTTAQAAMNTFAGATTSGQYLRGNGSNVVMSAIQAADVPTLNQNTTGSAGSVANAATFNNSGAGAASGATFDGSAARTISYNTIGAPSVSGANATGTWGISVTGSSASATNVLGGGSNQIVYNTGAGTTSFITAPTVANTFLEWSGSAFQWATNPLGTVTSVDVSGGTTGLTTSGGPITSSGTITLAGTLGVSNGGTGQTTFTDGQLLIGNSTGNTLAKATLTAGSGISVTNGSGSITIAATNNATVTSVDVSGGTTGLTFSGGPVTTSGTITMAGTLGLANGGSGQTTAQAAMNAFAGATTSGQYLRGNGSNVVMSAIQAADVPTLNQNTTGSAGSVTNAATFNNSGAGAASGTTFDGSAARTISYNTIGAPSTTGTNASGTWGISVTGSAGSATNVAGGGANQIVYNTGASTTSFITAPTVSSTFLKWTGSAFTWDTAGAGTVTSVDVSGGTTGLTTSGGPVTGSGTITLAGTLAVANGGTGQTTYTNGQLLIGNTTGNTLTKATLTAGTGISVTNGTGSITIAATNNGTVTSVAVSGGTTGLTTSGGPITSSGTITLAGTLAIANGGTGQTTAQAAMNAFAGATTSGQYLRGNGTNVVMSAIQAADVPTLNQNTTGSAGSVANAVTFNNSGAGAASGTTFNGSVARTISYNTVGAPSTTGTNASGTWGISITGTAATATNLAGGAASNIVYQSGAGTTAFLANGTAGQVLKSNGASAPSWAGIDGGTF